MTDTTPPPAPTPALRTSDPAVLRALAHPLRVEILDLLDDLREATASEVAERTDQTVANCSFHLRCLEKAGFVERAEPRGREKPWRPVHPSRRLEPDPTDVASIRDVASVAAVVVQREAARAADYFADPRAADPSRVRTTVLTAQRLWATPDELEELASRVVALADAFEGRDEDPSLRPEGAVLARFFGVLHPELRD
ncbi:ArsR/SmtB family transcription factor [Cellulomonas xiejunii]|uniref:Winged helix-turn-helix domain-containing protein n=1 Tax=Cellulomonas xiejunii TaxID=2968083 RepID=A0ABY5KMY9_9CELL|nr:winged helix-turn-helix domain-containing protein [Cellulomonas xiejunii]MCC2313729.1 winged helix-turn-helix domain-containing protein [Cellulomonas xiejunii]MCC2321060.1 winged helix-turn-helix domain-containing protein [Cellulomonas xiejunii]UUI71654.1 winged helix-turn-helix domain-containing protein [Cellulomonas xiejunii]